MTNYLRNIKILFLNQVTDKYKQIFYVPGNHEYYNTGGNNHQRSKDEYDDELEKICNKYNNQ